MEYRIAIQTPQPGGGSAWMEFMDPIDVVQTRDLRDVVPGLRRIEERVEAHGCHAAGFLTYEAAPAFDSALAAHQPGDLPLLWFVVFKSVRIHRQWPWPEQSFRAGIWTPDTGAEAYERTIRDIQSRIERGETYQVNYTLRMHAAFEGDAPSYAQALCRSQQGAYGAFIDIGRHAICSASPELFFRLDGGPIECRPMKGTMSRGRTWAEDAARADALRASEKNRSENLMIVDMVRNDLGRIARPGTVQVSRLFDIERYDTLLQMTSTISADTDASRTDILRALFPCASITGAPKIQTSRIIRRLESSPRGIYTGAIGYLGPNRQAQFSVAIRTVCIDRETGRAEYGTGGGIVWDSEPNREYEECATKALVLQIDRRPFSLLETLLWRPGAGYFLLDYHMKRLNDSARYFGIPVDTRGVQNRLEETARPFSAERYRVRLLVSDEGETTIDASPLSQSPRPGRCVVALARGPIDPANRYLYHKTTRRDLYDRWREAYPGVDDVILWNPDRQITESTIANVVVKVRGSYVTPPVSAGLLGGTYRAHLLDRGRIREGIVTVDDFLAAERRYMVNSVRGWIPIRAVQ